jgi:hypothetical protein
MKAGACVASPSSIDVVMPPMRIQTMEKETAKLENDPIPRLSAWA